MKSGKIQSRFERLRDCAISYVVSVAIFCTIAATSRLASAETDKSAPYLSSAKSIISTPTSMPSVLSSRSIVSAGSKQAGIIRYDADDLSYLTAPASTDNLSNLPNACKKDSATICYDYRSGRMVIVKTRELMPEISGLRAEGVTLKRDKIAMRYSFR